MEVISKVFKMDKYENGSCVNIKTLGHNQKFLKIMDKLDIVYCIEKEGVFLRINKFDFLRKISKEYPIFFSAMIVKCGCIDEWNDLSIFDDEENKNYNVDIEIKDFLIEMLCPKDNLVFRYTKEDIQNIYDIISNIRFDVMAKIYYERNKIPSMGSMNDISNSKHKMNDYELNKYYGYLSKFIDAKIYIEKYIDFVFKYKDEYPVVCEDIRCIDFLLEVKNEEEIKILLERLTEFYFDNLYGICEESEYFYRIIRENEIKLFDAKKRLLMMDSWEYVFIYKKINKLIWMNESLDILYDKNIREEISYALCNDNVDFVLDDILYCLVQSLCREYKQLNPIRACEFFDNLTLEEYDNDCNFTERKDIICNAIINKC